MEKQTHIYFKGLNALRFFAALAVIITHVELIKSQMNCQNLYYKSKLIMELGELGVVFFFVLSGFLITFLLLSEKEKTGTIAVKKFYLRRVLRIWPLYFLITALGFFILPHLHFIDNAFLSPFNGYTYTLNLILFIIMLPNIAFVFFKPMPHIGQTWSIGIEEQFYLLWPWLVKHSKNILKTLLVLICILFIIKASVLFLCSTHNNSMFYKNLKGIVAMLKIESMAIGSIGAWLVFKQKYYQKLLSNAILLGALLIVALLIYFTPNIIQDAIFLVYSVLFLIIILNVSLNKNCFLKLENKLFIFLGNLSYGIYMYHMIVIALLVGSLQHFGIIINNSIFSQITIYGFSILITILISWLSYTFFEKPFLKLKHKFTVIESGSF